MPEAVRYRRKRYLIATKFQLRYTGLILMLVFLTGILCSYVVYYTMMLGMGDKLANVYPQGRLISIVRDVNLRLFLSLILVAPFVVIIGIFASHKIAGPIYRIERFLDGMAAGDFSSTLTLRRRDELISLANGINRVLDSLKNMVKAEKSHVEKAYVASVSLKSMVESRTATHEMLVECVDKLNNEVEEAAKEMEKYKV